VQVAFNGFKDKKLWRKFFKSLGFHDLLRPIAACIDHNHGKPRAVDKIILPTESAALLIAAEGVTKENDIVIAIVVLEVRSDVEEVFVKRGLRRPPPKIILGIASHAGKVSIHRQKPRSDRPHGGQNSQEPDTCQPTIGKEGHIKNPDRGMNSRY